DAGVADLTWWMSRFDLDGLRIDAVPMMPRAASRHMVHAVRNMMFRPAADLYVVGETYTGPGDGGRAEIRAYLGDELDGLGGALAFVMTLPGVPVLYYGDEVGLAGGSDPDSRRVLPDVLGGVLPAPQQALLDQVSAIGRARRCSPALRGARTVLLADA